MWLTIILGLSTFNFLIASSHAATTNSHEFSNNCQEKCSTDICADEALRLIKRMDDQVDPCENFYEFACGTYLKETSIQDTNVASITTELQGALTLTVFTDLRDDIADTDLDAFKKIKTFFQNCIDEEIPAGFLSSVYKSGKPQYVNYGIAGAFIGHEIFHGFDTQGKQYDKQGNQVNWWTPEAEQNFKQKAQCIINQYGNFTVPGADMNINGELTQAENIADNGGFRAGYLAYREWMRRHNIVEGCLPSLNYTPQQMFWISSAAAWCSKERPEFTRSSLATDNHSPAVARVMLTFSNIKEFAEDFKCKPGSRMNPHNRCRVF